MKNDQQEFTTNTLAQQHKAIDRNRLILVAICGIIAHATLFGAAYDFGNRSALRHMDSHIKAQQSLKIKYDQTKVHQVHVGALTSIRVLPGEKIQQVVAEDNIQWEFKLNPNDTTILVKNHEPLAKNNRLIIDTNKTQYTLILQADKASKTMLVEYVR